MTLLNNRYEIIKKLGEGGFGQTFIARDKHLPSEPYCVIKKLHPASYHSPELHRIISERFNREAAVLYELGNSCDQIPRLQAYFMENGEYCLVQDLIEGKTLDRKVIEEGLIDEVAARNFLISFLNMLTKVHSKGIIHRDIKPSNVIMRQSDGKPVLIDFGIVREAVNLKVGKDGQPITTIQVGTPGFLPLEQAAGKPVYSSDLYSLGLTTLYMLTGKLPEEMIDSLSGEIRWHDPSLNLTPVFVAILDKAISSSHRERFKTAGQMGEALLHLPPIESKKRFKFRLPRLKEIRKYASAHKPRYLILMAIIALVILTAVSFMGWKYYRMLRDPIEYFARGSQFYENGELDLAIDSFSKVIDFRSDDPNVYVSRGKAYDKKEDLDLAMADFDRAIKLKPDLGDAYLCRGIVHTKKGADDLALADFIKAIKLMPKDPNSYFWRGNFYIKKGDFRSATLDFNDAIKLQPNFAEAYNGRGGAYYKAGNNESALADFDKAIALKPDYALAYYNRAMLHKNYKGTPSNYKIEAERALDDLTQAIRLNLENFDAYFQRADLYLKQNQVDLATEDLSMAIKLKPDSLEAYSKRSAAYEKKTAYDFAIADVTQIIQHLPENVDAYKTRARLYSKKRSFDLAITDINQAIRLQPDSIYNYYTRALMYESAGKLDLAIADMNYVITAQPEDADNYYRRGIMWSENNSPQKARADFMRALQLDKDGFLSETIKEQLRQLNN